MTITMKELARQAGVSRPAVSAVLNNSSASRVSPETRRKILELAAEWNFVPNLAARQLNGVGSSLIGMISVSAHLGVLAALQAETISQLQMRGFEVLAAQISPEKNIDEMIKMFHARKVDGIVIFSVEEPIRQTKNGYIPVVYCSHSNEFGFDVGCDTRMGGYLAAKHLLEHGRKNIRYFGIYFSRFDKLKNEGISRAMAEAGLEAGEPIIENDAEKIIRQIHRSQVDALVCCNDFSAANLMTYFLYKGIKVPEDIAMIGFDGYTFCNYTPVPLTTVVQPIQEQARRAVEILLGRIEQHDREMTGLENIIIPPVLYKGASCGCRPHINRNIKGNAFTLLMTEPLQ